MNKRLLLFAGNFSPEPTGIGKYNGEMIEWLANIGMQCTVVTTYPYYPYWKVQPPYTQSSFWFKKEIKYSNNTNEPFTIIRCPHYVPKIPSGIKRMISDFSIFFFTSFVIFKFLFTKKYDYVMAVAPPLPLCLSAIIYKKIKRAKFLYHLQDLQIDAAKDLKMIKSKMAIKLLFAFEWQILKNADVISTISKGMIEKIKTKTNKEIVLFPNWADTDLFYPIKEIELIKQAYGFSATNKIIMYSGAIGEKQGVEIIFTVAKHFIKNTDISFVICGEGPYKQKLEILKHSQDLSNVHFMPLQPLEKLNAFLNMADVHLIIQKKNTGDLVMPSKLTTILSVGGLAIVTASPKTDLYNLINYNKIGLLSEPENPTEIITCILNAINNDYKKMKENARNYTLGFLSKDNVLKRYLSSLS